MPQTFLEIIGCGSQSAGPSLSPKKYYRYMFLNFTNQFPLYQNIIMMYFLKIGLYSSFSRDKNCMNITYRSRANKGRSFYPKNYFWAYVLWCILSKIVLPVVYIDKIQQNTTILDQFHGCGYYSRASVIGASTVVSNLRFTKL